jgi:hypothetical protein
MQIVKDAITSALSFSSDVIIILVLVGLFTAYAFVMGKRKAISLILSFYPAVAISRLLPLFKEYTASNQVSSSQALTQTAVFLVILIPIHLILNQFIATEFSFGSLRKIIESLSLGAVTAGLAVFFSYQVVNFKSIYNFGSGIDILFSGYLLFVWLALPIVALFLFRE